MSLILWIHLMYTMFYFLAQLACETWFILIRGAIGSIFRCLHCFSVSTSLWFLRNRETDTPVKKLFKVKSKTCCCLILILSCCCFYKVELLFYKSQVIEILKYIRLIFFYNPCILDAFCRDNRYTILVLLACFVGSIFRLFYLLDSSQYYQFSSILILFDLWSHLIFWFIVAFLLLSSILNELERYCWVVFLFSSSVSLIVFCFRLLKALMDNVAHVQIF